MPDLLTIPTIINIAKGSGYMVANDIARGALFGEKLDPKWNLRLYMERKAVEWMYSMDPAYSGLTGKANYLYALCGGYGRRAAAVLQAASGIGTVITPTRPSDATATEFVYRIPITGAQFYNATEYRDPRIVGHSLGVYWNDINREVQLDSAEWTYTPQGIKILVDGFDATTTHAAADFVIYINDPDIVATGTVTSPSESSSGTSVAYAGGPATYALSANTVLDYLIVFPGSNATLKIGTTLGGEEVLPEVDVLTTGTLISPRRYSIGGETLYLTGLPSGSRITYFTTTPNLS